MIFQIGELVVYGTTGVCRVEEITRPEMSGAGRGKLYYLLKPLHQDGVIYTPVENSKVPMRSIISAQEAEALIDLIPSIQAEAVYTPTLQALAQHYQGLLRGINCEDLLRLMMSIYCKQQEAQSKNRRLGMVDERYMKQAERLLYGELSAALDIPFDEVQPYISRRVEGAHADNVPKKPMAQ
ncbi:CarD family transcriptional regulator [Dysosmobacter sp.]|uniref:CarD family transcriptional regulator n=1 Tax=Dysosmobacter sp. TaxID=2591382 RepID=UPI003A8D6C97